MPVLSIRLTNLEAECLDLLAHAEWSRGQVIRDLLVGAFKERLALSDEQKARLSRECNVRRRPPNRSPDGRILLVGRGGLFRQVPRLG